jgi:hypothetical protein
MNIYTLPLPSERERAQAAFAKLPNNASKSRAALARKKSFITIGDDAVRFLSHSRKGWRQQDPQLEAILDAYTVERHLIFAEFDALGATRWRFFGNRVTVQTIKSYSHLRLFKAIEMGMRYDELPRGLIARPLDGNTTGSYRGNIRLERPQRGGSGRIVKAGKTKDLSPESYELIAKHRAAMNARDDVAAAAYARDLNFIPVTLANGSPETVHLLTGSVPRGLKGFVPFPPGMTVEALLEVAPGINPHTYSVAMDKHGRVNIQATERIDVARLVWLVGSGYGDGLTRSNVLERLGAAPAVIGFSDGNPRNLKLRNLVEVRSGRR